MATKDESKKVERAKRKAKIRGKKFQVEDESPKTAEEQAEEFIANLKRKNNEFGDLGLYDFYAHLPDHTYIYTPTGDSWIAAGVNARLPAVVLRDKDEKPILDEKGKEKTMRASMWFDLSRPVEQMTWAPGEPHLIKNRLMADGGWFEKEEASCYNLYKAPHSNYVDPIDAKPWIDHVRRVYPDDADHIIAWFAQRVQEPGKKINHALVLGGDPGIGKDTILDPVKYAVGPSNFKDISPSVLFETFTDYVKAVILRISEARDLGETNRYQFYEGTKTFAAAPPDVLRCNEKNRRQYYVPNILGMIVTTNYKTTGLYLPPNDRRHYVAWSESKQGDFDEAYWKKLYAWYDGEGRDQVAEYLRTLDISKFNPKAPPLKTEAFWEIVNANRAPEDTELGDIIEKLGNPPALTLGDIIATADVSGFDEVKGWIKERKNARLIPHRMEQCGYVPVRSETHNEGRWTIDGKKQVVYAKAELSVRDRYAAAEDRRDNGLKKPPKEPPEGPGPKVADFEAAKQKRGKSNS